MACRNCECGCADTVKPVHKRYIDWSIWVKMNQHHPYTSSPIFQRELKSGKEWVLKNVKDSAGKEITAELNNYNFDDNQPAGTVRMDFYLT